jgi:hypothetical protein
MSSHIRKNGRKSAHAERCVLWDCQMMLAMVLRRHPQMAAGLAGHSVSEHLKSLCELLPRDITGKPHTAMTSSRT